MAKKKRSVEMSGKRKTAVARATVKPGKGARSSEHQPHRDL